MKLYFRITLLVMTITGLLSASGCLTHGVVVKESPVAKIGADYVYDTSLEREVMKSKGVVRHREGNDFYGFSPFKELVLMRGNLAYLIQQTALVQPASTLDKGEIKREADKRAQELVNDIYERLKAGESWDELSAKYSAYEDKAKGGWLPPFAKEGSGMPSAFYDLAPGGVLEPQASAWGYDIFRLDRIEPDADGVEKYYAQRILILPDESGVKSEMINDILAWWSVEIVDPVMKGFDLYSKKDYDSAMELLDRKSPTKEWPDLGYYVLSLCADAKGDTEARYNYLLKAVEFAKERDTLSPYYEMEIGDILWGKGDESAKGHYRISYDSQSNDYDIVKMLLARFEAVGDDEYLRMAEERLAQIEDMIETRVVEKTPGSILEQGEVVADKPDFEDL